jgi:hypothetical protein
MCLCVSKMIFYFYLFSNFSSTHLNSSFLGHIGKTERGRADGAEPAFGRSRFAGSRGNVEEERILPH